jgi:hypothetical protein
MGELPQVSVWRRGHWERAEIFSLNWPEWEELLDRADLEQTRRYATAMWLTWKTQVRMVPWEELGDLAGLEP